MSMKPALAETLKRVFRRCCITFSKSRQFEVFPLERACTLAGITEQEVIQDVLNEHGCRTELFDTSRLFTLVGLLAPQLSEDIALEALKFGLDLFEDVLDEDDGDGPWTPPLEPPQDVEAALSGYVWAAMAAPETSLRWQAAHVVRAWCQLNCEGALSHLIALAQGGSGGPFVDDQLPFYDMHARQWLLIALARAAKESPAALTPHSDFLVKCAAPEERHVLIRGFAAEVVLALANADSIEIAADVRLRLEKINESPLPVKRSKRHNRCRDSKEAIRGDRDKSQFHFGLDFGPYWYGPLASYFALSQADGEHAAAQVIGEWPNASEWWRKDQRSIRGTYREGETYHSHRSYPKTDDCHFYLSYHAMLIVAGDLLAQYPEHRDPDNPDDDFAGWLAEHNLSRLDRGWLADRRDPEPLDVLPTETTTIPVDWRWSIHRGDFDEQLFRAGKLNLWGRHTVVDGDRVQVVDVCSTLVSSDRSGALLRALHGADPREYYLPPEDDRRLISEGAFQLTGWIRDSGRDEGIDKLDPWAGGISFPPIVPAQFVVDTMNLHPDSENRLWVRGDQTVMWSEVWGNCNDTGPHDEEYSHGRRFLVSQAFVTELLDNVSMDMIVEVQVQRRSTYSRYAGKKDDDLGYIPSSARLFLIKSDGGIYTL